MAQDDDAVEGMDIDVAAATSEEGTPKLRFTPDARHIHWWFHSNSWHISQLYIAYFVEGLTIAAASANGAADADSTGLGATYAMTAGGASVNLAVASGTVGANATADVTQNHYGISITSGDSLSWLNQTAMMMVQQLITHQLVSVVHTQWVQ